MYEQWTMEIVISSYNLQQHQKYEIGINLTVNVKGLHWQQQNMVREIKGDQNKWRDTNYSQVVRLDVIKTSILPRLI